MTARQHSHAHLLSKLLVMGKPYPVVILLVRKQRWRMPFLPHTVSAEHICPIFPSGSQCLRSLLKTPLVKWVLSLKYLYTLHHLYFTALLRGRQSLGQLLCSKRANHIKHDTRQEAIEEPCEAKVQLHEHSLSLCQCFHAILWCSLSFHSFLAWCNYLWAPVISSACGLTFLSPFSCSFSSQQPIQECLQDLWSLISSSPPSFHTYMEALLQHFPHYAYWKGVEIKSRNRKKSIMEHLKGNGQSQGDSKCCRRDGSWEGESWRTL